MRTASVHPPRARGLLLLVTALAAAVVAPRLVLLGLGLGAGLLIAAALLGTVALWAVRRRLLVLVAQQQAAGRGGDRVVDGVVVGER